MTKFHFKLAIVLITFASLCSADESLAPKYQELVRPIVKAFSNDDKAFIVKLVQYPLQREYPIPAIYNEKEFLERYDEVFDRKFKEAISKSSVDIDWTPMGGTGIMLMRGLLWIGYDGKITAVNYKSEEERRMSKGLIKKERSNLHPLIRDFEGPELVAETAKFRIRIDRMSETVYRYASWPLGREMSEKPSLIIGNGRMELDGNGGNHYFEFRNGEFVHTVYVMIVGHDESPPGFLEVTKGDKPVVHEDIKKLLR